jgi:hypothetical protein
MVSAHFILGCYFRECHELFLYSISATEPYLYKLLRHIYLLNIVNLQNYIQTNATMRELHSKLIWCINVKYFIIIIL